MTDPNQARLEAEKSNLLALAEANSHVAIDFNQDSLREFQVTFSVPSISDFDNASDLFESADGQEIELILPISYPQDPPQMRWISPIFHPNVSLSGYLDTQDIGLEWSPDMSLMVVCERLWDIARFAWVDLDSSNNFAANRKWKEGKFDVPTDPNPLRDDHVEKLANVINYRSIHPSQEDHLEEISDPVDPIIYSIEDSGHAASQPSGLTEVVDSEVVDSELVEVIEQESQDGGAGESVTDKSELASSDKSDKSDMSDKSEKSTEDRGDVFVIEDSGPSAVPPIIKKKSGDDDIFVIE